MHHEHTDRAFDEVERAEPVPAVAEGVAGELEEGARAAEGAGAIELGVALAKDEYPAFSFLLSRHPFPCTCVEELKNGINRL